MRRRGFLQLAGAAVLGVLTAKVPVFAADTVAVAEVVTEAEFVSMWVYPVQHAIPTLLQAKGFDLVDPSGSVTGRAYLAAAKHANYQEERRWNVHSSRGYVPAKEAK